MGNLTGTEGVHLPKYVQALGFAMAECSYTHRVHLARRSNDTDTRRILSFWPSNRGRFVAELAWDKKKYSFDVTPRDDITFLDCGNAVVRAVKDYAPGLPLEGEKLFSTPPVHVFMRDKITDTPSRQNTTAVSDELSTDDNYIPHEDTPVQHTEETVEPFTVPADIWNARTLALYHAALEGIFGHNDPSEYCLVDDHHGKIRALTEKMQNYFAAAAGPVHRALEPLRKHRAIKKEITMDNVLTGWWIVRFVINAPPAEQDLKILWDSRKHQQGKPLRALWPPASSNGSTALVPEPLDTDIQNKQPHEDDAHASIPDGFDAKVKIMRALLISLNTDVHKEMNSVYATITEFCRKQNDELARQQTRFADFLTTQDTLQAQNVSTLLTRLLQVASQEQ